MKKKFKKNKNISIFVLSTLVILFSSVSLSQENVYENTDKDSLFENKSDIENVERIINIDQKPNDAKIRDRISSILESSNKYTELDVQVNNGLIFLTGTAVELKYIEWASDISKNVNGVVGIVNDIDVQPIDYLTIDPIKSELLNLWFKTLEILPLLVIGVLTFLFFFFLSKPLASLLVKPFSYLTDSQLIQLVLRRVISLLILLIGAYFFLRIAGLSQFALAIISGTGVIGLVIGFAFRDIAENFISSLLISLQRPFHLNDVIEVSGHKGVVRKVTARGTTLIDFDGNHIQIPNSIIYKNIIQNFSANPTTRGNFIIGIGYDASIKHAQEIAINLMLNHEAVLIDPEPQVLVENLGSSTVNLKVIFWVDSQIYSVLKVSSILMRQIMREFERYGLSMPDDAREIIFPDGIPISQIGHNKTDSEGSQKNIVSDSVKASKSEKSHISRDSLFSNSAASDNVISDVDEIRQQADSARDPESGSNII